MKADEVTARFVGARESVCVVSVCFQRSGELNKCTGGPCLLPFGLVGGDRVLSCHPLVGNGLGGLEQTWFVYGCVCGGGQWHRVAEQSEHLLLPPNEILKFF